MAKKVLIVKQTGKAIEDLTEQYMRSLAIGDPKRYEIAEEAPEAPTKDEVVAKPEAKAAGKAVEKKAAPKKKGRRPASKG